LPGIDAIQKLPQRRAHVRFGANPAARRHAALDQHAIDILCLARAGVKRVRDARGLEQPARLLANLRPLLIRIAIAPLVQQPAAVSQDADDFVERAAPLGQQIEKARDDDGIERGIAEWQRAAVGDGDRNGLRRRATSRTCASAGRSAAAINRWVRSLDSSAPWRLS
jgi:hypothetical protein